MRGCVLIFLLWAFVAAPGWSHGTSTHSKQMTVENEIDVNPTRIRIHHIQRYHEAMAHDLWVAADRDEDGVLSRAELAQAKDDSRSVYLQWCRLDVDWKPMPPRSIDVQLVVFPEKRPASFDAPFEMVIDYVVDYDIPSGTSPLRMLVFNCTSLNAFTVKTQAQADGVLLETSSVGDVSPGGRSVTGAVQENGVPEIVSLGVRLPGDGSVQTASNSAVQRVGTQQAREQQTLQAGLMAKEFTVPMLIWLFISALGLGMLHALSPGHGKTMVAAYMIASRGRAIDAIVLGAVVTATHVSVVILLGVGALVASKYVLPERIAPVLEIISGLLVLASGFWLIVSRAYALGAGTEAHDHHHGPGGHTHVPDWMMERLREKDKFNSWTEERVSSNPYDFAPTQVNRAGMMAHDHHGDHSHGPGGHSHGPDAGHSHDHGHSQAPVLPGFLRRMFASYMEPGEGVGLMQLLVLGISGGMVPCPTALVVLLVAVSIHRIALGLCLILTFSVGLAAVLMGIGLAFATASPLVKSRREWGFVRFVPLASAFVVTALGFYMTGRSLVDNGWITIHL